MFRSECNDRPHPPPNFLGEKTQESENYCLKSVLIEENITADVDKHTACSQEFDACADNEREERAKADLDSSVQIVAIVHHLANQRSDEGTCNDTQRPEEETTDGSDSCTDSSRTAATENFGHIGRHKVVDKRYHYNDGQPNPQQRGREGRAFAEKGAKQTSVTEHHSR